MFNIDKAISDWRKQMLAAGVKNSSALDELHEHLRSDIEQQMRSGTDAESAFCEAVQRIGTPSKVRDELAKVRTRPGFALEPLFLAGLVLLVVATFCGTELVFAKLHMGSVHQIFGFLGLSLILLITCAWRYALPHLPVFSEKQRGYLAICFGLLTAVLGALAAFVLPESVVRSIDDAPLGSNNGFIVAMIWAGIPMAIVVCTFLALVMDGKAREHWGMNADAN
jgi:hypothetical protein